MTEREVLKLALEALKQIDEAMPFPVAKLAIMEAEKALAQPEQEPVAWLSKGGKGIWFHEPHPFLEATPLYTTPPQRTWVGLTWEDANEIAIEHDVRPSTVKAIEAKLKEKNT